MYDYYKSTAGYLSAIANILLVIGIILLFFNPKLGFILILCTVILWIASARRHKKARRSVDNGIATGFIESAARLSEKYKSPEGIAELKSKGFTDNEIKALQDTAEEDSEMGVFRDD